MVTGERSSVSEPVTDDQLREDLVVAIRENQFYLVYQPQFDLENSHLTGVEALLRWKHPVRGIIPPMEFIPLAERYGLISEIGLWVLREACRQLDKFQAKGTPPVQIAINVSPQQFLLKTFTQKVENILNETNVNPSSIEIEITESMLMQHGEQSNQCIQHLQDLGIRFAIDDFGTGYSSLSQLQCLSFNTLKIDRSFVNSLETNPRAIQLVESLITLGHNLGMNIVGEGIETQSQLHSLRQSGCDMGQGYLLGRPTEPEEIIKLANEHSQPAEQTTVLIAEDEEMVLRLTRQILRAAGYKVLEARNGRDALSILESNSWGVDVLITDQNMPVMNGDELSRIAREQKPELKIIFISGYAQRDQKPVLESGTASLEKPFGKQELLETIQRILG